MKHSSKKMNKIVCLRLIYYGISILNRELEMINPEMRRIYSSPTNKLSTSKKVELIYLLIYFSVTKTINY